ncbi:hypothetical protein [Mycolicibacter minnesotensis]
MRKFHGFTMLKRLGFGAGLLGATAGTLVVTPNGIGPQSVGGAQLRSRETGRLPQGSAAHSLSAA